VTPTPANQVAAREEPLAGSEGVHHDCVEVEAFTEHPQEVTRGEVMADTVQHLTPHLGARTQGKVLVVVHISDNKEHMKSPAIRNRGLQFVPCYKILTLFYRLHVEAMHAVR